MKKILTILLLTTFIVTAQNKMVWADKVLFIDGLDSLEIENYNQILGNPNARETFSKSACTFKKTDTKKDAIQAIRVSFSLSTEAKQLIIAQNYFSGAIKEIIVFDSLGHKKSIYTAEPKVIIKDNYSEFLGIDTPKDFKIKEVEIVLNLDYLEEYTCQIDAIGLLKNTKIPNIEYFRYQSLAEVFRRSLLITNDDISREDIDFNAENSTKFYRLRTNQELIDFIRRFKMQWAEKDATASSEDGFYAQDALGKPSFSLEKNINTAWQPKLDKKNEWIEVGYNTPQTVRDILVFKNADVKYGFNMIALLDSNGKIRESFSWNDKRAALKNQNALWHLHLTKPTSYKVAAIKVFVDTKVYGITSFGHNTPHYTVKTYTIQIDAIGISNESIKINEIELENVNIEKESLGKFINSEAVEVSPLMTYDGKQLFFVCDRHPKNKGMYKFQDAWVANWGKNKWEKPENLDKPINTEDNNAISAVSPNGKTLYLLNSYMPNGSMRRGISTSKLRNGIWSFPKELKVSFEDEKFRITEFAVAPNRKVLVMSASTNNNYTNSDLYVSFLNPDNTWTKPTNIGETINTNFNEGSPFIAADNRTLYFSSKGHLGYGDADIFMSQRLDETWTNWSEPINLGDKINTPKWDGYFNVIASGEYAYTCSLTKNLNKEDIFKVNLPTNAKPKPVAILKGTIKGQNIQKIEAVEADNTKESYLADFDEETNEYILILPVDKKYNLNIIHEQNTIYQSLIDLTTYKVYNEMKKNINLNE
jgi:hypothetical protein